MDYSAYLFDLYGTLADIHTEPKTPSAWRNLALFYTRNGAAWKPAELQSAYWSALSELVKQHPDPCYEPDLKIVLKKLFLIQGLFPSSEQIQTAAWELRKDTTTHLRLYAGAKDLLYALRKKAPVILLSNAQSLFTLPELDLLGLADCFDAVYLSSDYGTKKPSPSFFRKPPSDFGLDPARCLMIGNDPICDIEAALAVGMDAYYIHSNLSPKGLNTKKATYVMEGMDLKSLRRQIRSSF